MSWPAYLLEERRLQVFWLSKVAQAYTDQAETLMRSEMDTLSQ
jgi:hypothetical protein